MNYEIIEPPFTLKFREMTKKELLGYNKWFHAIIPERVRILAAAVKSVQGYGRWEPDCFAASLEVLGEWFLALVDTRPRTPEEISAIEAKLTFPINVPDRELTNRTYSLAMDIGMYLSQVFLQAHPSLEWGQPFGSKRFVDYGQPVLIGLGVVPFNPVRMMVVQAHGLISGGKGGGSLRELFDIWSRQASSAQSGDTQEL